MQLIYRNRETFFCERVIFLIFCVGRFADQAPKIKIVNCVTWGDNTVNYKSTQLAK